MNARRWVVCGLVLSGLAVPAAALACGGGGVVSARPGSVGANTQRVVLSVNDDGAGGGATTTDVVAQIGVPSSSENYGVLLPVPSEPTLDPTPISSDELDRLDEATGPIILSYEGGSSSGCGCLGTGSAAGDSKRSDPGVRTSAPVNIGPVTAVVVSGGAEAVSDWLRENGFALSAADEPILAEHADGYFIALRRNEAATQGPTSIGVHYTMAGDHRVLSLRFARIGAASKVAFTAFVVANEVSGPSSPFAALTLADLDWKPLQAGDYAEAVRSAVERNGNKAFVLESQTPVAELPSLAGTRLAGLFHASTVTRLTTVLPATALTEDALFFTPYKGYVPNERHVQNSNIPRSREAALGSLAALLVTGIWRRRRGRARV